MRFKSKESTLAFVNNSLDTKTIQKIFEQQHTIKKVLNKQNSSNLDKEVKSLLKKLKEAGIDNPDTFSDFLKIILIENLTSDVVDAALKTANEDIYNIQEISVMMNSLEEDKNFITQNVLLQKVYENLQQLIFDGVAFDDLKLMVDEGVSIAKDLISNNLIELESNSNHDRMMIIVDGVELTDYATVIGPKITPLSLENEYKLGEHCGSMSWDFTEQETRPDRQEEYFNEVDKILNAPMAVSLEHDEFILRKILESLKIDL